MIEVKALTFRYQNASRPALSDVTFTIDDGEIFGFLGPSGAGKSTTQKILIGLLQGYEGTVKVFDRDLNRFGADYYEHVGVSFELPHHYLKLSARENLTYFAALYRGPTERPLDVLAAVGLDADADKRVGGFSKGMLNRLSIARALLHKPKLLFLDEPTSGLDPVSARRIKDLIRQKQAEGVTVFMTTHDMAAAEQLCDRVAFIVDGRISLIDQPRALNLKYGRSSVRVEYERHGKPAEKEFRLTGLELNSDFLGTLPTVQTIHSQESTLEQIFVEVTGQRLT
ncbi:MAG: ABC transporter ATP-binding protein [Chloroflexota bacterium]